MHLRRASVGTASTIAAVGAAQAWYAATSAFASPDCAAICASAAAGDCAHCVAAVQKSVWEMGASAVGLCGAGADVAGVCEGVAVVESASEQPATSVTTAADTMIAALTGLKEPTRSTIRSRWSAYL